MGGLTLLALVELQALSERLLPLGNSRARKLFLETARSLQARKCEAIDIFFFRNATIDISQKITNDKFFRSLLDTL